MLTKEQELAIIEKRNKEIKKAWRTYYLHVIAWVLLIAGLLVYMATLNAYMVIPSMGHQISIDLLMYAVAAISSSIMLKNILYYKDTRDSILNDIRKKYNPILMRSEAFKLAYEMVGMEIVDLDSIESKATLPKLDNESDYDWMFD